MKWNTGDVRGALIKVIAEKILSEELFEDSSKARQALVDALSELKFETKVSDIDTDGIATLQIYYKSEDAAADLDRAVDIAIVPTAVTITPAQKALRKVVAQVLLLLKHEVDWKIPYRILNSEIHYLEHTEFEHLCSHLNVKEFEQGDTVIVGNLIFKNNGPEGVECGCETCQCQPK